MVSFLLMKVEETNILSLVFEVLKIVRVINYADVSRRDEHFDYCVLEIRQ